MAKITRGVVLRAVEAAYGRWRRFGGSEPVLTVAKIAWRIDAGSMERGGRTARRVRAAVSGRLLTLRRAGLTESSLDLIGGREVRRWEPALANGRRGGK